MNAKVSQYWLNPRRRSHQGIQERADSESKTSSHLVKKADSSENLPITFCIILNTVAARRLVSSLFNVSTAQLKKDIEEDYYDQ